jgi:hypothetical protein
MKKYNSYLIIMNISQSSNESDLKPFNLQKKIFIETYFIKQNSLSLS